MLGINDGADALASLLAGRSEIQCNLGRREMELHVSSMVGWHDEISLSEIRHTYRIEDWLPLNADNFRDFSRARGIIEKLSILQRVLRGNILSFAKGMDIFFDTMADCTINDIDCTGYTRFKGVELMSFSGFFSSNVRMPQWIGLGKSASLNHGTIIRI